MMDEIEELRRMAVFAAVVKAESFSEAARRLGVAKSAVSKQVAELEQSLGVRLMNRTTRNMSLTEAGERFYQSCAKILDETARATSEVRDLQTQPLGTLRLTAPSFFGHAYVVPEVGRFLEKYEQVRIDLLLTDRHVDLFEENVDLAIRIGRLADSSLVAKKLAPVDMLVLASSSYLEAHGRPQEPQDLASHSFIAYTFATAPSRLDAERDGDKQSVRLQSRIKTNSGEAIRSLLRMGHGIGLLPAFYVQEDLEANTLVPILEDWSFQPGTAVFAVYPHRQHVLAKVRLFVESLQGAFNPPPWA